MIVCIMKLIHPLKKYAFENETTTAAIARESGIDGASLSRICSGEKIPSALMAAKIRATTNGEVNADSMLDFFIKKNEANDRAMQDFFATRRHLDQGTLKGELPS